MTDEKKRGLGRGLSALFGEDGTTQEAARSIRSLPIERLHPGKFQPRRKFDGDAMAALVESVRSQGVLQPLLVRPHPSRADEYEILAGERRWRAAQAAKLLEVPVLVRAIGDREALEAALVENVQREDLGPLEEADGYQRLIDEFGHTQEALAKVIGKSRSHIANTLRLLGLPPAVRQLLERGDLTAGHARALLTAKNPLRLAQEVIRGGLNVRQTEGLARTEGAGEGIPVERAKRDPELAALERELAQTLGLKVEVHFAGDAGRLVVHYKSLDQLDEVLGKLRG
jgi:ParB family transcriptional regulator, chromosome partitioning protein